MARFKQYQRDMAYRVYVSDSLYVHGTGKVITVRYSDFINPPDEDDRTGEEIIEHMKLKLKGLIDD